MTTKKTKATDNLEPKTQNLLDQVKTFLEDPNPYSRQVLINLILTF